MLNTLALVFILVALPVILVRKSEVDKQDHPVMRDWVMAASFAGIGGFIGWEGIEASLDPSGQPSDVFFPAAFALLSLIIGLICFHFRITLLADRIEVRYPFRTKQFLLRDMLPSSMDRYDSGILRFSGGRRVRVYVQYSGKSRFIGILRERKYVSKYYSSDET